MNETIFKIITQIIGIIAATFSIASFQFKNKKVLCAIQSIAIILFVLQFIMLKSYGGCILNAVMLVRTLSIVFIKEKYKKIFMWITILLVFVVTFFTIYFGYDNYLSLLPCFACIVSTVEVFQNDPKRLRYYQIFGVSIEWLIYDAIRMSIGGVITEVFVIVSSIIFLLRIRKEEKENEFKIS